MKRACTSAAIALLLIGGTTATADTVSITASADTYVRQNVPDGNYGDNGGMSVAGSAAVNGNGDLVGLANSFIRFDASSLVAAFDSRYGAGKWTITGVSLGLVENAAPPNAAFGRGQGDFLVQWLDADNWGETSLTWNTMSGYLGAATSLGQFKNLFIGDQYTPTQRFSLALDSSLVNDILAGDEISLCLTPAGSAIGFTFNSLNITGTRPKPFLEVTAAPEPASLALLLIGGFGFLIGRKRR